MTEEQLCNLVLEVSGKSERSLPRFRILGLASQGLELLAKRIAAGPGYQGLQKDFSATPSAGRFDLTTLADLLFDMSKATVRISSSNVLLIPVDAAHTLEKGDLVLDDIYYTRLGNELVFKSTDGAINTFATALKIKANFIPTLATLPAEYKTALTTTINELATGSAIRPELYEVSR